ncbi:hypothetical protein M8C21_022323 [Ambrosia artemisiifolia]|uniref:Uncharacterized protein n=1 Tax=Ambrosia artemisiifolia TaxID=4212 RepID=A0AAD5GB65_AMBAR|nr:hypothetical protein M8C21_022323 [Ambrosia artemisiifolia]
MCSFTTDENMNSSSASSSWSSPYDSEDEDLQLIESAPPFWKNSKKVLSKQLSMLETRRELAWEKKRLQRLMQELKREHLTIENPNELFDEDLNELKGCIDLGFVFDEEKGGQSLANTLPALDAYFAVNRLTSPTSSPRSTSSSRSKLDGFGSSSSKSLDERNLSQNSREDSWKICGPGENPQQIKAKLRHWAQLVACSVRQTSSEQGTRE